MTFFLPDAVVPKAFSKLAASVLLCTAITPVAGFSLTKSEAAELLVQAGNVADIGASERVDNAGKLRMLSQRIPAAACNLSLGIETDKATAILAGASDEFLKIVNALEHGDETMSIIGEESRKKTLRGLMKMREVLEPIKTSATKILANGPQDADVAVILDQNMDLLKIAQLLVSEISGQYSNPAEMTQADAMLVDISGRQRMLTQKMAKEACIMSSDRASDANAAELGATMTTFETSLMALLNGMDAAGIKAAPTPAIKSGLDVVLAHWMDLKGPLDQLVAGGSIDAAQQGELYVKLSTTMVDMNTVVGMYTSHAKGVTLEKK